MEGGGAVGENGADGAFIYLLLSPVIPDLRVGGQCVWSGRSPIGLAEKTVHYGCWKGEKKITAVLVFMQMTSFLVATNHLFCYSGLLLPIENRQQRDEHSRYEVNAVVVIVIAQTAATEDQLLYIILPPPRNYFA